jgi:putative hemolysin
VILALVALNGLLAGSEMAIVSVRKTRLVELVRAGHRSARAVQTLRDDPESFLATVQVGITVVGAAAGAFGGAAFAEDLEPVVRRISWLADYAPQIAFAAVVVVISYLSVVLGELVPKSLALRASERYALLVARPLLAASRVARPVVRLLSASSNLVLRLFGDRTSFVESRLSAEEIRNLVEDAAKTGDVHPAVGDIAARALGFATLTAEDVMVHRRFVVSVSADTTVADACARMAEAGHDRVPVLEARTEEALGYVTLRDLVAMLPASGTSPVRPLLRPGYFVPESMAAPDLLRELQRRRARLAIVVDEHGGTVGIVSLQDLLEELVGEMLAEYEPPVAGRIRRQPDGAALVDGIVPVRAVNRELGVDLPEAPGSTTIGGLCAVLAGGRIPAAAEALRADDGTVIVPVEVSARRVRVAEVRPPRPAGLERGR